MHKDWFFPSKLAARLSVGNVANREVAYLMLANSLFALIIFYGAFTWANPPWTLLSLIECITVIVVTIIGFTKCFDAAGGDKGGDFARDFSCLSFGVWFWATLVVWTIYWAVVFLFRYGVFAAYRFDQMGLAINLATVGGSFEWLWTFVAAVCWQAVYFAWMARLLKRTRPAAGLSVDRALGA